MKIEPAGPDLVWGPSLRGRKKGSSSSSSIFKSGRNFDDSQDGILHSSEEQRQDHFYMYKARTKPAP